ncbi:DUF2716 domain-containing protein [Kribbella sp. CWNU-51]
MQSWKTASQPQFILGRQRWGTFGHPWQRALSIWGDELIESLGTDLLTWLPRHLARACGSR